MKFILKTFLIFSTMSAFAQIDRTLMDLNTRPQDDLFQYVNGSWMKKCEIPADKSRWGSFDELIENTDSYTLKLVENLITKEYPKGTDEQKIKDLYASILDMKARNIDGINPLKPYFAKIENIKSLDALQSYLEEMAPEGKNPFFQFYVENDMKKSSMNAVYLSSPSLGLGRDYFQKEDPKSKETLMEYGLFLNKLSHYINPKNKINGDEIVAYEKEMAKTMLTVENMRNSELQYNPIATKDLNKLVKNIDLQKYLINTKVKTDTVIIPEIGYYKQLDNIITEVNLPKIRNFLKLQLLNSNMSVLSQELDTVNFEFYGKKLSGQLQQRAKEKRALEMINNTFGEVLGKVYVKEAFPPAAKQNAVEMVEYIKKSFKLHIENLTWMSPATKIKALEKLAKFTVKIGYPDKWKDYSKVSIKPVSEGGSYFSNLNEYSKWQYNEMLSKVSKPVDRTEWGMNPQMVNAYYNPQNNEIVFPAAILQSPFYDYKAHPAINFGGIGGVIGHEISHGFDDSGCLYDGDGNLNNWWSEDDKKNFEKASQALVDQYNKYEPLPGVFVNGKFTLGENIADLGGVSVGIDALKMYLKDHPQDPKVMLQNSAEQLFFMSWATIWRCKLRDKEQIRRVKTDPHSPGYFRAIGPVVNADAFHNSFNTLVSDKMYKAPKDRIIIW